MIRRLRAVDHSLLVLNLLLLLGIGALPFTTALIAEYLRASSGEHLAAGIYAGSLLAMSVLFYAMQHHILYARRHLLPDTLGDDERNAIDRRNRAGLLPYLVATALAPVSPYVTLAICGAVAVFYALPQGEEAQRADAAG
jgi:uncharacterized membrane protein